MKTLTKKPKNLTNTCEKHGEYQARFEEIFAGKFYVFDECQQCVDLERREKEQAAKEQERKESQDRLLTEKRKAGLKARHLDSTLGNFRTDSAQQQTALNSAKQFISKILNGGHGNLIMAGKVGTGKTHLAAAMVSAFIERKKSAQLIKLPELMREIKATWGAGEGCEAKIIARLSGVQLLVLDEIGVQYGSDTEKLIVSEIIDNRYQELLPTVLVSNLDVAGIKACIGERCYDRLREDGGTVVGFDWSSFRGAA